MGNPPASRRERRRIETVAELKAVAREHLVAEGAEAVALRAIARDLGMAPGTVYGYFDTREALLAALAVDLRRELVAALRAAGEGALTRGLAYREWALEHPHEFQLVFSELANGADAATGYELCLGIVGVVAAGRVPEGDYTWEDFDAGFTAVARERFPQLTPSTLALGLRFWGRLHGLVTLEVDGVLRPQVTDPARLYRDELEAMVAALA